MSKALELFSIVPRELNCAQCIVCGAGKEELSASLASFGGGRAPEGCCGALYAAQLLVPPEHRAALAKEFETRLGHTRCRDLKAAQVACPRCVETAASLAEKYGKQEGD